MNDIAIIAMAIPEKGVRIPPPPGLTADQYARRARGFVGDR